MRKILLVVLAVLFLSLILFLLLANYTEVDRAVRTALAAQVPQAWQARLRPLRAPLVIEFSPGWEATDVSPTTPVSLTFLTEMDKSTTEDNITIEPEVEGRFTWEGKKVTFTPEEEWPLGTEVTVSVGRDARSWLWRRMEEPFTFHFSILGPPTVVETEPAQGAKYTHLRDRLVITFSRPMDQESVESRLFITPELYNQHTEWKDDKLFISGAMRPSTQYRVAILSGAVDADYQLAMEEDFVWTFTTTREYPYLAIVGVGRFGLVSAGMPAELQLEMVNVSRLDYALYPVDIPTYIEMQSFSYESWRWFEPETEPLKTWSSKPDLTIDKWTKDKLELGELKPGIYYLTVRTPEKANDGQVLLVSRSALTLKRTTDEVLVWATEIESGQPIADLTLTVYDSEGQSLAEGQTDAEGLFISPIPQTEESLHVIGQREDDLAACSDSFQEGIEPWRFEEVRWQWRMEAKDYNVFIYTDRPLYRPGQQVNFKGIVRRDEDGEYSQPPAGTPVHVKVENWEGTVLYDETLQTTPFGSIFDSFDLNEEVGLGQYFIRASIDGEEYEGSFSIQEYRKPEYQVTVSTDQDSYINGDAINATINATYLFGAPVVGANVDYTLYSNDYFFRWAEEDFDFTEVVARRYYGYGVDVASGSGTTDEAGRLTVSLPADISREERSQVFTLEATVTDPSNQPISGRTTVLVHQGNFYIGLRPERYVAQKGKEFSFNVQTVDTEGQPLGKVPFDYTIVQVEWRSHRTAKGYREWEEITSEVSEGKVTTDSAGRGSISFVPPRGGSYRLQARGSDERGNRVLSTTYFWASEAERMVGWRFENNDRIQLVSDKRRYRPGDTAQVLVQSPYQAATALITVERGRLISHRLVELDSNSAIIEIPVTTDHYPNVYVSSVLIPQDGFEDGVPSFKVGYVELKVDWEGRDLEVTITPEQEVYHPGENAIYTIQTADAEGNAVAAELSLGVIDAAIFLLAGPEVPDIAEAFYGTRPLAVRTAQSLSIHVERLNLRRDYGGGGGPGEEQVRAFFPDVAYWNPAVTTDESGQTRVSFALPDNLTTWRAVGQGVTAETKVGSSTADLVVTKDLILRPVLPRFLTRGDQATLGAIVHNFTGQEAAVDISMEAPGLTLPAELTHSVVIDDREIAGVTWPVSVPQLTETVITMRATTEVASDAVQLTLPVLPFGDKQVLLDAGQVEDRVSLAASVPADATYTRFSIDISPSLAAGLIDSLEYLTGYPYGCVEQTMSRFLPDVLVTQTLTKLGIQNEVLAAELPKQVEDGLFRLYRFQHYDGGWGWWESDETQVYQTAYVVYGLTEAKKAGYPVDEEVLKNGLDFLHEAVVEVTDADIKTYALYVLTNYGEGDLSMARTLMRRQAGMELYSRAYLAITLQLLGSPDEAKTIIDDLVAAVVETANTAHWVEKERNWWAMSSDGRTTALILQALLKTDPSHPLVPKVVRWLMRSRLGGYWRTTQETAATIIALTDYLAVSGELEAKYTYQVLVDGKVVGEGEVTKRNISQHQEFEVEPFSAGDHQIEIAKEGSGRLYYATSLTYYLARESLAATRSLDGPIVQREYLDAETDEPLAAMQVGDLIRVKITVEAPTDLWYVVVEDPLPAGTEAVNQTLQTTSLRAGERRYYWSHPELRDEKAAFFTTILWEGRNQYTYLIRAITPGQFRAMPTEVYPMYEPDLWGRSSSAAFTISP